jgi:hypothetical protein
VSRQLRQDGKPRNQWALWMARRARASGKADQELVYEMRADELSDAELALLEAAKAREFARKWRAAGGNETLACEYETRADELEKVTLYPWPGGTSRALAETLTLLVWPDCPVSDAPDAALHGILSWCMEQRPQLVYTARAKLADNGYDAERNARVQKIVEKTAAEVERAMAAARADAERDPFDPLTNGAGEFASPDPTKKRGRKR